MKVTQEVVTLFTDKGEARAIEISNGSVHVYRLVKMSREDRFRLLTELQNNGEKSEEGLDIPGVPSEVEGAGSEVWEVWTVE